MDFKAWLKKNMLIVIEGGIIMTSMLAAYKLGQISMQLKFDAAMIEALTRKLNSGK